MMLASPQPERSPGHLGSVERVRRAHIEWVTERLSGRDWQIIEEINRLRLLSGHQIERLCFGTLEGHSRPVVRGRVLRRLVRWKVLAALPRRIGGAPRGSAGAVYALGTVGVRLLAERQLAQGNIQRVRHPGAPTDRTLRHTLAVSELYVGIIEQAQAHDAEVEDFQAEPASWWHDGRGGYLKPDAYAVLSQGSVRDHWWIEVDLATESLPTVIRKMGAYLDFAASGQLGPAALIPRVLISCMTEQRRTALRKAIERLPVPSESLFHVVSHQAAAQFLIERLLI